MKQVKYEKETVKQAAVGCWPEILAALGDVDPEFLDGRHHPCPKCGGTDRFRMLDADVGALLCNQCFAEKNGDGLAALQWLLGLDFQTTVNMLAEHLGMGNGRQTTSARHLAETADGTVAVMPPRIEPVDKPRANGDPRIVAMYDYRDETGELVFQVVRRDPKDFRQRRPKDGGGWNWSVKDVRVIPYRLPEFLADTTRLVAVVEGEKDVDNLARIGVLATCNAGGAGKWKVEHAEFLRDRTVVVLGDNDKPGRAHAQQVAATLPGVAKSVQVVELPDLAEKGDISDWIAAGGTKDELKRLVDDTPEWTPESQPWPEIESFDDRNLPEFPTHILPRVLRNWVQEESHATQTPADLAGLLSLAVCSATIARRVEVEPRLGWREPTNVFTTVLLGPANRKSAVFSDAIRPLRELQNDLVEDARPDIARKRSEWRQAEARLKKLEKRAAEQGDLDAREQAGSLAAELAEQAEPVLPRLLVDDATGEKIAIIMAEQGGRLASMSPEGGVFDLMAGRYSKSGDPQFDVYLKGHAGDDLVTDRVSRESVRVERPALTCAYAVQPQVLRGLAGNPAFRGRGLLARFLYADPRSWIGRRLVATTPVSDAARDAYHAVVRSLHNDFGVFWVPAGPFVLRLAPVALGAFMAWAEEIESMLADGGEMEAIRDWGGKLAGATLRLAAVLHCVEHGLVGSVDEATVAAAIEIARYLTPHAEAVMSMMEAKEDPGDENARYVLRRIVRRGSREFTRRELRQNNKTKFRGDFLDAPLIELERRGCIRLLPTDPTGPGRPSSVYQVNPALFENETRKKRPKKPHYSADRLCLPPDRGNFGVIGVPFGQVENENREVLTI